MKYTLGGKQWEETNENWTTECIIEKKTAEEKHINTIQMKMWYTRVSGKF